MAQKNKSKPKFSRNDLRHWEQRVFRPKFKDEGGEISNSGHFHIKIQAHNERRGVSLKESKVKEAAKAAKKLDALIQMHGWEKGLKLFRGETPTPKNTVTLGEYLAEVEACKIIKSRTMRTYTTKVRTIAAFITNPIMPDRPTDPSDQTKSKSNKKHSKYDYINGGALIWQQLVDATPLRLLNTEKITAWRQNCLEKHADNPKAHGAATRTANSCIRAGKAIFSSDVRAALPAVKLPDPIPFSTIRLLEEGSNKYRSQISSPDQLLTSGVAELAVITPESELQFAWTAAGSVGNAPDPTPAEQIQAELRAFRKNEAFKVLVLSLCAGLRRGEIDSLLWTQVDFANECLWMETTDVHQPKADSVGKIGLDPQIMDLLRSWRSDSKDQFVIKGSKARPSADKVHYRANRVYNELIKWLRQKGITSRMAVHTMRKEYGSIICAQAGIHAASRLLRHANISMTAAVYADHRTDVTAGLGAAINWKK